MRRLSVFSGIVVFIALTLIPANAAERKRPAASSSGALNFKYVDGT